MTVQGGRLAGEHPSNSRPPRTRSPPTPRGSDPGRGSTEVRRSVGNGLGGYLSKPSNGYHKGDPPPYNLCNPKRPVIRRPSLRERVRSPTVFDRFSTVLGWLLSVSWVGGGGVDGSQVAHDRKATASRIAGLAPHRFSPVSAGFRHAPLAPGKRIERPHRRASSRHSDLGLSVYSTM